MVFYWVVAIYLRVFQLEFEQKLKTYFGLYYVNLIALLQCKVSSYRAPSVLRPFLNERKLRPSLRLCYEKSLGEGRGGQSENSKVEIEKWEVRFENRIFFFDFPVWKSTF